jgi:anti-sigma B factor antagonist
MSAPDRDPVRLTHLEGQPPTVTLSGEIDLTAQPQLRSCLAKALTARPAQIVIDMTDLTFIDSSGLAALVIAHQQLTPARGGLVLTNVPAVAMRVLEITGLHHVFSVPSESGH